MKAIAGAIVIFAGSVLCAAAVIADAIQKAPGTIPRPIAGAASFMGYAIMLIGAVVMAVGLMGESDQPQSTRTD